MFTKAILIPGGGLDEDGKPHLWVRNALDKAISTFTGTEVIIPLSRGTIYKPPILDKNGFPIYESVAAGKYLLENGIPKENILLETLSLDTIGNAYFSRLVFIDPLKIIDIEVITASFHLPRVQFIFEWIYNLRPTQEYHIIFTQVNNGMIDSDVLAIRIKKEQQRLEETKEIAKNITDLTACSMWLFHEHKAYAFGSFAQENLDPLLLKTY